MAQTSVIEHCGGRANHWPHVWAADAAPHVCSGRLPLLRRLRALLGPAPLASHVVIHVPAATDTNGLIESLRRAQAARAQASRRQ